MARRRDRAGRPAPRGGAGGSPPGGSVGPRGRRPMGGYGPHPGAPGGPREREPMVVYGRNPVLEAVRGPRTVHRLWATAPAARSEEWLAALEPDIVSDHDVEELCGSADHQGVCAEVEPYGYADPK